MLSFSGKNKRKANPKQDSLCKNACMIPWTEEPLEEQM